MTGLSQADPERSYEMHRRLAVLLATCLALAVATPVAAAPQPGVTKDAIVIEFDCGSTSFQLATVQHNAAAAGQIVETGGVGHIVAAWGYSTADYTGEAVFFYGTPGYDHNGHDLLVCDFVNPAVEGLYIRALVDVRP